MNLAINGFGRIGRLALRVALLHHANKVEQIVINTSGSMDVAGWAHLLKYDTAYGKFAYDVRTEELKNNEIEVQNENSLIGYFIIQERRIPVLAQRDPEKLPWREYEIDVVIESTGKFTDAEGAGKHLQAGARAVVISAPTKSDEIRTYVLGVNTSQNSKLETQNSIVSNASCTTNCISPVTKVIHDAFGVNKAFMTTVHGYTDDQRLQDNSHKDLRRARAAAENIVPTSTGAATATTLVIPELKGLFDGISLRVPVITGSAAQMTYLVNRQVTVEEVNGAFEKAAQESRFKNILKVTREPLVSSDIIGDPHSAIVDLEFTRVVDGDLVNVLAWYDNEWGYTNRLVEQALSVGEGF
jgi:glyceraldehyde 3-phosphate dehydrogenase